MTKFEKKARLCVKDAYFDYLVSRSTYCYTKYSTRMEMLIHLFPTTTDIDRLEKRWKTEFERKY